MVEPVAVIFAGGQGTRLWPLSRADAPKQFQPLLANLSLTTAAVDRLRTLLPPENIFVSTSVDLASAAEKCLGDIPAGNLIVEASGKGPQVALALSAATARHRFGDVSLFTCPSDHLIEGDEAFTSAVAEMFAQVETAPEAVVLLGAVPTRPDPNLGYFVTRRAVRALGGGGGRADREAGRGGGRGAAGAGLGLLEHHVLRRACRAGPGGLPEPPAGDDGRGRGVRRARARTRATTGPRGPGWSSSRSSRRACASSS